VTAARARSLLSLALGALAACSQGQGASSAATALPPPRSGPVVARIGDEAITAQELSDFARREHIGTPREALDRYVNLRLLARRAMSRGGLADPVVIDTQRRASVQALLIDAVEKPVNDRTIPPAALQHARRTLGFRLSHGPLLHVVHALVAPPQGAIVPDDREGRRARAEAIRAALAAAGATADVELVRRIAEGVRGPGQIRVESVTGFDPTGATGTPASMDATFAAAAATLEAPGAISTVVDTSFGFHVIVLERREPAAPPIAADELERQVRAEALLLARTRATQTLLGELRARYRVQFIGVEEPAQ
jgi:PPIC-type PPIASE domain